jgi:hypothetical protein
MKARVLFVAVAVVALTAPPAWSPEAADPGERIGR